MKSVLPSSEAGEISPHIFLQRVYQSIKASPLEEDLCLKFHKEYLEIVALFDQVPKNVSKPADPPVPNTNGRREHKRSASSQRPNQDKEIGRQDTVGGTLDRDPVKSDYDYRRRPQVN